MDAMRSYDDEKTKQRKFITEQLAATVGTNDFKSVSVQLGN